MTKAQIAEDTNLPDGRETTFCEASTSGLVVLGIDFRSKRRERIYDADKIWSGQHTMLDYTEI